jgi:hypothetical protein
MGATSATIITAALAAHNLNDTGAATFGATVTAAALSDVIRDISLKNPLRKRANLALTQYTLDVDISPLTIIDDDNIQVEYIPQLYYEVPIFRNFKRYGSTIVLDYGLIPTITSGTLTGTVTFTQNSRSITGSSTLFTSELAEGDFIGKSGGSKFYQVAELVSNTALTLSEPFEETGGADTVSLTKYRDDESVVRVYYGTTYTVSTTSDMPYKYDNLAILGVVAYCAVGHLYGKLRTDQTQSGTDLASVRTNVNTVTLGDNVAENYANIANIEAQSSGRILASYRDWANLKWAQYQDGLRSIEKIKSWEPKSRS